MIKSNDLIFSCKDHVMVSYDRTTADRSNADLFWISLFMDTAAVMNTEKEAV